MFEKEKERGSTKFTWLDPVYASFSIVNFAREVFFFGTCQRKVIHSKISICYGYFFVKTKHLKSLE